MNRLFLFLLIALALGTTPAFAQNPQTNATERSLPTEQADIIMRVDGLACPFCAHGLEKKLRALEATQEVEIKLNQGLVLLTLKPERSVTDEVLTQAVTDSGFVVRSIERREPTGT